MLKSVQGEPSRTQRAWGALDRVPTRGGGPWVIEVPQDFGASRCVPVYNALDPATHCPIEPDLRFAADLSFLGDGLPDRETRVEQVPNQTRSNDPDNCAFGRIVTK